jgi:hypothetical protein
MMEAARTSETSVDNYFTRQYILEDNSELHTRRRENLKSHRHRSISTQQIVSDGKNKTCKLLQSKTNVLNMHIYSYP